jgi:SulP family sulfate permease
MTPSGRGRGPGRRVSWSADVSAGLTVALVGLPQCLAYALMSGLPPAYGLSTAAVAGLIAAATGRSAQVVTGPTNTTGLLVLAALGPFLGANGLLSEAGLPTLATLTLLAGLIRIIAALAGGAHLVRFMPESVLVGFTAGAGVLIGLMQLDEALGLAGVRGSNLATEIEGVSGAIGHVHPLAIGVTLGTIAVLALARRLSARVPWALLSVVAAAAAAWAFGLDAARGLPLVGDRASVGVGWPPGAWPSLDPALIRDLLVPASAIVLLGTLELTVTARAGGERPDMRREILAQGWANAVGAFASAFPASASLTRSALLRLGGGQTRLAAATAAVLTAPLLFAGAGFVAHIPQASLAGVLLYTAVRMIDRQAMARLWRASYETRLLLMISLVATLVLPLEWAILLGSGTGLLIHLARTSAPRLRLLRPDDGRLVPAAPAEAADAVVIEVSGDLHYAAVPPFVDEVERLLPPSARAVVLDLSHAHQIRFSALRAFERIDEELRHDGAVLVLAGVDEDAQALIERSGSGLRVEPAEQEPGLSVRRALDALGRAG